MSLDIIIIIIIIQNGGICEREKKTEIATYSAPHIWDSLPHVITGNLNVTANTLKKKHKTFYYTNCYS